MPYWKFLLASSVLTAIIFIGTLAPHMLIDERLRLAVPQYRDFSNPNGGPSLAASTSLVFIKTHKTGGTTVASIINRFGLARNLSFLLYKNDSEQGHFRNSVPQNAEDILPPVGVRLGDYANYRGYNLMTSHMRFLPCRRFLQRFMSAHPKFVTVLREPTKQWESAFFFFNCAKIMRHPKDTPQASVDRFLSNVTVYWEKLKDNKKYYTRNGMWFDLSANISIHTNTDVVYALLRVLEQRLDLVLITEYLDESLLLLKKLMHWDFQDIVYVKLNQRDQPSVLNAKRREMIKSWNQADSILYDHFNRTLWKKIREYGVAFQQDLFFFRTLLREHRERCGIERAQKDQRQEPKNHIIDLRSHNKSTLCQELVKKNMSYDIIAHEIHHLHAGRLTVNSSLEYVSPSKVSTSKMRQEIGPQK